MKIAPLADIKAKLSQYLDEAGSGGPVVITRNGRPVGVLVATADDDEIERLVLAYSPRFRAMLDRNRATVRAGRGLDHDDVWSKVS